MKHLLFILFLLPLSSSAKLGIEINGGVNMHAGPFKDKILEKGFKPAPTFLIKTGRYNRKKNFGVAAELGRWEYSKKESGYAAYGDHLLNGNNYSSIYAFFDYAIINKKAYFAAGTALGIFWLHGGESNTVLSNNNYINNKGGIPGSSGFITGLQFIAGYNVSKNFRIKAETGARYGFMSFKPGDNPLDYRMVHFPITIGVVIHNFGKRAF